MEKAILCSYDFEKRKDGDEKLIVQFNPATYSIQQGNNYEEGNGGIGVQEGGDGYRFLSGKPSVLSVELFFDTYVHGPESGEQADVREKFSLLQRFLQVEPGKRAPLPMKFSWGSLLFIGVVTQMQESYTMFSESGLPVRAKINLSLQGCRESELIRKGGQGTSPRTRVCRVAQSENLWSISQREYGSPENWRDIARANGIENPRRLQPAMRLVIPAQGKG